MNKIMILLALLVSACGVERRESRGQVSNNFEPQVSTDAGEGEGEVVQEIACPNRNNPTGVRVGDTFPSAQFPNAEREPVNIKDLCGSKAILVVSATEWCGACIAELNYLVLVAADWRERGGEIYYTLFEDGAGQPAGRATLERFEEYLLETTGDVPFRILADSGRALPNLLNGNISLPLAWALDEELVVRNFSEGTNAEMVTNWMENLLDQRD